MLFFLSPAWRIPLTIVAAVVGCSTAAGAHGSNLWLNEDVVFGIVAGFLACSVFAELERRRYGKKWTMFYSATLFLLAFLSGLGGLAVAIALTAFVTIISLGGERAPS
ncbi:MAG: hypothetical protein WAN50_02710 [Minisyncoccia bacterium]